MKQPVNPGYICFLAVLCSFFFILPLYAGGDKEATIGTITIGILPDVDSIPFIIAEEKGFFSREGVHAVLERFNSPVVRDTALQAGKVDGVVSDILAAAFAVEGGFPVLITSKTNGSYKFLAAPGSGIGGIEDVAGKPVAMSRNTIIEYCADRFLGESGIDPSKVIKTAIPQIPVRLEMLIKGMVDSAVLPEPLASVAMAGGAVMISASGDLGINPGVLLFRKSAVKEKSGELKAMYRGYNRAVEYLRSAPETDYIDLLINGAGFPEEVRNNLVLPKYEKAGLPSEKEIEEVISWLLSKELIKRNYTFKDLVDGTVIP